MPTEISNTEPASTIVIGQEASQGPRGFAGWTPVIAQIPDGLRLVNKLLSYQGGEGVLPTSLADIVGKFQKADGTWTSVISEAFDINSGSAANAAIATTKASEAAASASNLDNVTKSTFLYNIVTETANGESLNGASISTSNQTITIPTGIAGGSTYLQKRMVLANYPTWVVGHKIMFIVIINENIANASDNILG
ncbi:hypothetical protein, partial [Emticicia sp. W12TSBA100-4]|uniref:hypothetical protein n=1 Tax=Emticicia sp. W12TSBA100-4 TaxID=3160965 RepID=UPI0033068B84